MHSYRNIERNPINNTSNLSDVWFYFLLIFWRDICRIEVMFLYRFVNRKPKSTKSHLHVPFSLPWKIGYFVYDSKFSSAYGVKYFFFSILYACAKVIPGRIHTNWILIICYSRRLRNEPITKRLIFIHLPFEYFTLKENSFQKKSWTELNGEDLIRAWDRKRSRNIDLSRRITSRLFGIGEIVLKTLNHHVHLKKRWFGVWPPIELVQIG